MFPWRKKKRSAVTRCSFTGQYIARDYLVLLGDMDFHHGDAAHQQMMSGVLFIMYHCPI